MEGVFSGGIFQYYFSVLFFAGGFIALLYSWKIQHQVSQRAAFGIQPSVLCLGRANVYMDADPFLPL